MWASRGSPCLNPKLSTATCQRASVADGVEGVVDAFLELVHVQIARVDHEVGGSAHRFQHRSLELDRLDEAVGLVGERMPATSRVVAAYQLTRGGIQGHHAQVVTGGSQLADLGEHLGVLTPGHQREPFDVTRGLGGKFDDRADQGRREIVDDEPPEILEYICHPRSPGPDNPVISTMSATQSPYRPTPTHPRRWVRRPTVGRLTHRAARGGPRRSVRERRSGAAEAEVEEAGDGGGFGVLLGAGEETVGRHRLDHVLEDEAVVRERVEVSRERSMHEPDEHAVLDLFDEALFGQIRPDAPVLLGRIDRVVVDPVAPRRLQQRMVEEEREPTAGPNHPGDLGDRGVDIVDVFEHETRHSGIEARIGERQVGRAGSHVRRSAITLVGDADLVPRRVDAHDARARARRGDD